MKIKIFDKLEALNEYLLTTRNIKEIKFQSFITKELGKGEYEVIDRFMVIEK